MLKRVGAIIGLSLIVMMLLAPLCFGATEKLKIEKQHPKNGATGTAVTASIKLWFNQDVKPTTDAAKKANQKAVKLVNEKGKEIPITVFYNPKDPKQAMILEKDPAKTNIKSDTKYILTIDSSFQSASGAKLVGGTEIVFTTLNQSMTSGVSMGIMGVMIIGMIYFSSRSVKKQSEKGSAKKKVQTVNPYKEAKRTGKSVQEIVAREQKKAQAQARKEGKPVQEDGSEKNTKRVAGPRPISAAGSTFKQPIKTTAKPKSNQQGTKKKGQAKSKKKKKKK